jgi:hypothetical protein
MLYYDGPSAILRLQRRQLNTRAMTWGPAAGKLKVLLQASCLTALMHHGCHLPHFESAVHGGTWVYSYGPRSISRSLLVHVFQLFSG